MKCVGGIDLGLNGAWAIAAGRVAKAHPTPVGGMPSNPEAYDLGDMYYAALELSLCSLVCIEAPATVRVPRIGSKKLIVHPGATAALWHSYGLWEMALFRAGVYADRLRVVPARTWQAKVLKGLAGTTKERSIARAKAAFPGVDLQPGRRRTDHDGMADALCLSLYGIGL